MRRKDASATAAPHHADAVEATDGVNALDTASEVMRATVGESKDNGACGDLEVTTASTLLKCRVRILKEDDTRAAVVERSSVRSSTADDADPGERQIVLREQTQGPEIKEVAGGGVEEDAGATTVWTGATQRNTPLQGGCVG